VILMGLLLVAACRRGETTSSPEQAGPAASPTSDSHPARYVVSATSDAQKNVRKDDSGLPLEYKIEVPEVPEELLKPSPPISAPGAK